MKKSSFDLDLSTWRTREQVFLKQMDTVVVPSLAASLELIALYSDGHKGKQSHFGIKTHVGVDTDKRPDAKTNHRRQVAMSLGKRRELDKENKLTDVLIDQAEKIKVGIRAKEVDHSFRVIKRQFGFMQVRYQGLKKNTLQLKTLFTLSSLWMVCHKLMGSASMSDVKPAKASPKRGNSPQMAFTGVSRSLFQLQTGLGCA